MGKAKADKIIDDINEELNQNEKEKQMKNIKNNQTVKTVLTVAITLLTVAAFIGTFIAGMNYQKNQDNTIKREAISLSEQMAASKQ